MSQHQHPLKEDLERIDKNTIGLANAVERLNDRVDALEEERDELRAEVESLKNLAQTAHAVANQQAESDENMTKKRVALLKSRNELVRRAAVDQSAAAGQGLKVSDVVDMAKPEVHLEYQTVKDAWGELVETWGCFDVGHNEDDNRRLELKKADVDKHLVRSVEHDLDRDDLAKRLISEGR